MLLPGLQAIFAREHFSVVHNTVASFGCGFNPVEMLNGTLRNLAWFGGQRNEEISLDCASHVNDVWAALQAHVQQDDVVMVATAYHRFWWMNASTALRVNSEFLAQLNDQVIAPRGAQLVLIDDIFFAPEQAITCAGECSFASSGKFNAPESNDDRQALVNAAHSALTATAPNVHFVKVLFDSLCDGSTCHMRVPGTSAMAYMDDDHLSSQGAMYVAPFIACAFEEAGLL